MDERKTKVGERKLTDILTIRSRQRLLGRNPAELRRGPCDQTYRGPSNIKDSKESSRHRSLARHSSREKKELAQRETSES